MSTAPEEFGARVIRPSSPSAQQAGEPNPERQAQALLPPHQSPKIQSPAVTVQSLPETDFDPHVGAKPCSPFYRYREPAASLVQLKSETQATDRSAGSQDLERGLSKPSMDLQHTCSARLWTDKRKSRFSFLRNLTKRQKLAVKLFIALLIVGTMVGIALGITAAVHGGVWKSGGGQGPIGH